MKEKYTMMELFNKQTSFLFKYQANAIANNNDLIFIFNDNKIYLYNNNIPTIVNINNNIISNLLCFGEIGDQKCFCLTNIYLDIGINKNFSNIVLKTSYLQFSDSFYQAAILANHLSSWCIKNNYCGACAMINRLRTQELSLECSICSNVVYPTISPVVIGLIYNNQQILLAKPKQNTSKYYGCISGFVNPGENLEHALKREVFEEVGVKINNIKYITSQHWPFPNSLMIGFIAQYISENIKIDNKEIADAKWFDINNLPELPNNISISRHLIDHYCSNIKRQNKI